MKYDSPNLIIEGSHPYGDDEDAYLWNIWDKYSWPQRLWRHGIKGEKDPVRKFGNLSDDSYYVGKNKKGHKVRHSLREIANMVLNQPEDLSREYFKEKVYQTVIPRNVRLSEAPSHGMPVLIYDKSCTGSKSYFSFTEEFLNQDKPVESAA